MKEDGRASLCIRTCNSQGEGMQVHNIDGLCLDADGNLHSVFEDAIIDAIFEVHESRKNVQGGEHPLSYRLADIISRMPDLMDWIISSILSNGRNLVFYSDGL